MKTFANIAVDVQKYLRDPILPRCVEPLEYWSRQKMAYLHMYDLAKPHLCTQRLDK